MKVIATIAIKGATEALRVAVVHAGGTDRQAHSPVAHVSPDKGPRWEDQLGDQATKIKFYLSR